jgi:hypothetical protein
MSISFLWKCCYLAGIAPTLILFVGVFAKLDERTAGRLRVEECDVEAFGTLAGSLVDKAAAFFLSFGKSVGYTVLHSECYVLDAAATAVVGDELGYCTVVACAFKKLDFGLSYFEEGCTHFLVGNFLNGKAFKAKNVLVERYSFVQAGNGYAHVFDVRNVHFENVLNMVHYIS